MGSTAAVRRVTAAPWAAARVRRVTAPPWAAARVRPALAALALAAWLGACTADAPPPAPGSTATPTSAGPAARTPTTARPDPPAAHLVAAGDIALCDGRGDEATAALIDHLPGTVAALGDTAYPKGT